MSRRDLATVRNNFATCPGHFLRSKMSLSGCGETLPPDEMTAPQIGSVPPYHNMIRPCCGETLSPGKISLPYTGPWPSYHNMTQRGDGEVLPPGAMTALPSEAASPH